MGDRRELGLLLGAGNPLIVVETDDEPRFLKILNEVAVSANKLSYRPLFRWTVTDGLQRLDLDLEPQLHNAEPTAVLRHIRSLDGAGIYALLDFHPYVEDPVNTRLLKDIALSARTKNQTVVLISHRLALPQELARLSSRFEMALPNSLARGKIIDRVCEEYAREHDVAIDEKAKAMLVENLAGLSHADTERLARGAIHDDGALAASDLPGVMQAKYDLLNRDGLLHFEYETARFAELGGFVGVKSWLEQRKLGLKRDAGIDSPKGMLLIGIQGCGKSLAAKAAAGVFGVPLLRLDVGGLYNKYHGETERNLRQAMATAEVMAPCVLWVDEIEKSLATGEGDSGTSRRVLATLLTWMEQKEQPVFVVATANDISALPPELIRKGRFDEIFFVDLPTPRERAEILHIHLTRRGLNARSVLSPELVTATDRFSGAEIEQGIVAGLYAAQAEGVDPKPSHFLEAYRQTRPLAVVMAEPLAELRRWAEGRTVPAGGS